MGRLKYSQGSITIEMDETMDRLVRRAIDQAAPGVLERVEADSRAVYTDAHKRWPVVTGRSRAGLTHEVIVSDTEVRGRVSNPVDYAFYVRPKKLYGASTAWSAWVQQPMRKAANKLAKELGPLVRRLLGGR